MRFAHLECVICKVTNKTCTRKPFRLQCKFNAQPHQAQAVINQINNQKKGKSRQQCLVLQRSVLITFQQQRDAGKSIENTLCISAQAISMLRNVCECVCVGRVNKLRANKPQPIRLEHNSIVNNGTLFISFSFQQFLYRQCLLHCLRNVMHNKLFAQPIIFLLITNRQHLLTPIYHNYGYLLLLKCILIEFI